MSLDLETYFERAVNEPLRATVLSGEAAIVFSAAFDKVMWANADGARLFGGGTVAELLESPISTDHSFIRQVHEAAEQIENDESIVRGFRISRGLTAQFIQCELRSLTLGADAPAILLTCALPDGSGRKREHERAQLAVDGLSGLAWASAIVDGSGLPLAVSEHYAAIDTDDETIVTWLNDANASDNGIYTTPASEHDARPGFVLRLIDRPQRYLIAFDEHTPATDRSAGLASDDAGMAPLLSGAAATSAGAAIGVGLGAGQASAEQTDTEVPAQDMHDETGEAAMVPDDAADADETDDTAAAGDEPVAGEAPSGTDAAAPTFHGGMHQTVTAPDDAPDDEIGDDEAQDGEASSLEERAGDNAEPQVTHAEAPGIEAEEISDKTTVAAAAAHAQAIDETAQPEEPATEGSVAQEADSDEVRELGQEEPETDRDSDGKAELSALEDGQGPGEEKRPQPIRSLLERWFMRRGDEEAEPQESGDGDGVAEQSGVRQSAETVDAQDDTAPAAEDEDTQGDEEESGNGLATAGVIAAAGAGIVASTVALAPSDDDDAPAEREAEHDEPPAAETETDQPAQEDAGHAEAPSGDDDEQMESADIAAQEAEAFAFAESADPVRFAWTTDDNQTFVSVSPELAETLGPNAADIVGRRWQDVAKVFGFDESGEIAALLERRDTWSGKSVLWPVQGADLTVPVDLAALPAFGASRAFEGFRGFGIIRTADAVVDPDEIGLALAGGSRLQQEADAGTAADGSEPGGPSSEEAGAAIEKRVMAGRSDADDAAAEDDDTDRASSIAGALGGAAIAGAAASNVVDLTSRKRATATGETDQESRTEPHESLSGREAMAFEEIGRRLGGDSESRDGQAVSSGRDGSAGPQTAILEQLPVPVIVYRNGHILFANRELLDQTGYPDAGAIDAAGGVDALFGAGAISEGDDTAQKLRCQDGSEIEVSPLLKSVPWDRGKALLLTFRPTALLPSQEKEAIDIARVSELQNILDTASDGIIVLDQDGVVESVNAPAEQLFGIRYDEAARDHITGLFVQESHKTINDYVAQAADPARTSAASHGREAIAKHADGSAVPLFLTLGRMGEGGKLCAVLRDITRWKKAEEDLVSARRAAETASEHKSDFLARVSHEIRTPLNAIIGFSDVMIEERFGPVDNERYREYLRDINRSGIHILDLINDLLDISKIEAGKMELSFEAVDLSQIVAETVALLQPQANVERILIRTSLSRAVPRVVADARTIRQIVLNLVSNAIKFTASNGQVIISTVYEANGEVVLKIRDTGKGMSEDELEQALKPFSQIGRVDERRGEGTGLGLPLTKALVEANRAHFDLESVPGEGTIALVQFPTQRVLAD